MNRNHHPAAHTHGALPLSRFRAFGRAALHLITIAGAGGGIALSVVLMQSHLTVYGGGVATGLFCGSDDPRFDCGAVSAHPSSWLLGLPLPLWGMMYYILLTAIALGALMMRGTDRKAFLAAGSLLTLLAVLFDVYLAIVMLKIIGSTCLNCIATYALNLGLLVAFIILDRGVKLPVRWLSVLPSVRALWHSPDATYYRSVAKLALVAITLTAGVLVFVSATHPLREIQTFGEQRITQFIASLDDPPDIDMTVFDDLPRIPEGLPDARVQVVLVGDFQCAFCRSLAATMDELYAEHPDDIKMIFVHSPVANECNPAIPENIHPEACWLAQAAECAAEQRYFWTMHRFLFLQTPLHRVSREHVLDHLERLYLDRDQFMACMASERPLASVRHDVDLCGRLGLTVTPSLVINGHAQRGSVFPWMLRRMVEATLAHERRGEQDSPPVPASVPVP